VPNNEKVEFTGGFFLSKSELFTETVLDFVERHYAFIQRLKQGLIGILQSNNALSTADTQVYWKEDNVSNYLALASYRKEDCNEASFRVALTVEESYTQEFSAVVYLDNAVLVTTVLEKQYT
jgi:hypothetical protein